MKKATIQLLIALIVVFCFGLSCSRVPQEDQAPPSSVSSDTDPNGTLAERPSKSADQRTESSSPNQTSIDPQPQHVGRNNGDPSTMIFTAMSIDLNSGDLKGSRYILDGPPLYGIYESDLSKEIRRLGIPIPEQRRWMPISRAGFVNGGEVMYVYEDFLPAARRLLSLLAQANAPDEERRAVLEKLMTSLRTEKANRAIETPYRLIVDVCDRYGLDCPLGPKFVEQLRQP